MEGAASGVSPPASFERVSQICEKWNKHIYNFTPNHYLTKIFYAFFNCLDFSIFRISVLHLTHVRTGVYQATPLDAAHH